MIHRIFLLAISMTLLMGAAQKCPDHYNPIWFEEASDELVLIIDEYFTGKHLSFLPTGKEVEAFGLKRRPDHAVWELPESTVAFRELRFPVKSGIWCYEELSQGITSTHLLIPGHTQYSEIEAINTYNGLLGSYWNDYNADGYEMTLKPEESRIRYGKHYFELTVKVYGLKNDATPLERTNADLIFRDDTEKVNAFIRCREQQ